jgi:hypothetical protein
MRQIIELCELVGGECVHLMPTSFEEAYYNDDDSVGVTITMPSLVAVEIIKAPLKEYELHDISVRLQYDSDDQQHDIVLVESALQRSTRQAFFWTPNTMDVIERRKLRELAKLTVGDSGEFIRAERTQGITWESVVEILENRGLVLPDMTGPQGENIWEEFLREGSQANGIPYPEVDGIKDIYEFANSRIAKKYRALLHEISKEYFDLPDTE